MLTTKNKLELLRARLAAGGLDGFIVPHADEYLSEYTPPSAERLAWLTGFTGSSGASIVLGDKAFAQTDGRYTIQIRQQVDNKLFDIADMAQVSLADWLKTNARKKDVIGYDAQLHTQKQINDLTEKLKGTEIVLKPVEANPIDAIWNDRPAEPAGLIELFPDKIAGASSLQKRQDIAAKLRKEKIDAVVIIPCDSICWLLNVRGDDIDFNPVILSRAVLWAKDGSVDWFVDAGKIPADIGGKLDAGIRQHDPADWFKFLKGIKGIVQFDPQRSPLAVAQALKESGCDVIEGKDPCILPKACKTEEEQLSLRQAHIRDGLAVVRFLFWLDCQRLENGHVDELTVERKLEDYRRADPTYRGPSFATIAGWNANGAIIHYHSTPETNQVINGNGLLLLDSGGQYEYGTTDITRTIVVGQITDQMREHFTRCLKGHIAVATARFDDTTTGVDIDKLARISLQEGGVDFGHSTGHGVGCFLSVHEEASSISPRGNETFKPGMLLSNEPGCYIEGEYGIRLENLMLCQEDTDGKLFFDTVTLVPFDLKGINWKLMTETDKAWLYNYHRHVYEMLAPFLDDVERDWLREVSLFS